MLENKGIRKDVVGREGRKQGRKEGEEEGASLAPFSPTWIHSMWGKRKGSAALALQFMKQVMMSIYYVSGLHKALKCFSLKQRTHYCFILS